jgi:hypothetical protein
MALVAFVLLGAAAPHEHAGPLGAHACAACVAAGGEAASAATPAVAPRLVVVSDVSEPGSVVSAVGAPLGAVPGQSPPLA